MKAVELRPQRGPTQPHSHFALDRSTLWASLAEFREALPEVQVFYALKANPDASLLRTLADVGAGFEAASWGEIELLLSLGIHASRIIYGSAVKPRSQVECAYTIGVDRFAADSREEIAMLAEAAPGSRVFIRVKADHAQSVFQMGTKFGVTADQAVALLLLARDFGLVPWGVSFNVGSQARDASAWADGIRTVAPVFKDLLAADIRLDVLNVGGGFPAAYAGEHEIPLAEIGAAARTALAALPYSVQIIAEPGRRLIASSMTLTVNVVRRIERCDGPWLFLDCGVYNALFEALSCQGRTRYPVHRIDAAPGPLTAFVLAGPTGDGLDIVARDVLLPADTSEGNQLRFKNVGAYTSALASTFNGFQVPPIIDVCEQAPPDTAV